MSIGYTHWCYRCIQPICPTGRAIVCPHCEGGFLVELAELGFDGGGSGFGFYNHWDNQYSGITDTLSSLTLSDASDHRVRYNMGSEYPPYPIPVPGPSPGPMFIYPGQIPPPGAVFMPPPRRFVLRRVDRESDDGSESVEPTSTQESTPPAPRSTIDAMPTVKITRTHLQTNSHCTVCQEEFKVGTKARQMPCNHIYHSDCIVPWLVEHNSCPVCRHPLEPTLSNHGQDRNRSSSNCISSSGIPRGNSHRTSNPLSFLWPFRSSRNSSSCEYGESSGASQRVSRDCNHESTGYSGWPFN